MSYLESDSNPIVSAEREPVANALCAEAFDEMRNNCQIGQNREALCNANAVSDADRVLEQIGHNIAKRIGLDGGFGTDANAALLRQMFLDHGPQRLVDSVNRAFERNNVPYYMGVGENNIILYTPQGTRTLDLQPRNR